MDYYDDKARYPLPERVDSTTIDTEHAELHARGFIFQTNARPQVKDIEHSKARVRRWFKKDDNVELVVHPQAYDICGRHLENYVSIWAKKKE